MPRIESAWHEGKVQYARCDEGDVGVCAGQCHRGMQESFPSQHQQCSFVWQHAHEPADPQPSQPKPERLWQQQVSARASLCLPISIAGPLHDSKRSVIMQSSLMFQESKLVSLILGPSASSDPVASRCFGDFKSTVPVAKEHCFHTDVTFPFASLHCQD